jgi:hypothetical protein
MNGSVTPSSARDTVVVVRQLGTALAQLIVCGGLLAAHFLVHGQSDLFNSVTGGGAVGLLMLAILTARFRYKIGAGRVTAREALSRSQSVDLTRLTRVLGPDQPETFASPFLLGCKHYLELHDDRGSAVKLTFSGTTEGQRRRMLDALEPYVMADGVSRAGLVREALAGQQWRRQGRG